MTVMRLHFSIHTATASPGRPMGQPLYDDLSLAELIMAIVIQKLKYVRIMVI